MASYRDVYPPLSPARRARRRRAMRIALAVMFSITAIAALALSAAYYRFAEPGTPPPITARP